MATDNLNVNETIPQTNEEQKTNQVSSEPTVQPKSDNDILSMMLEADGSTNKAESQSQSEQEPVLNYQPDKDREESQQQQDITPEEAERLIATTPELRQVRLLEEAGLSREEALKQVYNITDENAGPEEGIQPDGEDFSILNENPYLKLSEEVKADFFRLAQNPTDNDVINWAETRGTPIPPLPEFEDKSVQNYIQAQHRVMINNLKEQMKHEYTGHCQNINYVNNLTVKQQEFKTNLNKALTTEALKDFPEINTDSMQGKLLYKDWVNRFAIKRQQLPTKVQNNQKVLEALNKQVLNEMKAIKPQLYKYFNITKQQQANTQANQMLMNNMNAVNATTPTNDANVSRIEVRRGNMDDIMALMDMVQKSERKR